MVIKMTREKIIELCVGLANSFANIRNTKFAYALQKNVKIAKKVEKELEEYYKPSDAIKEYDKKRGDLCIRFSKKDSDLKPIIKDQHYVIDNQKIFDKELTKLQFGYSTALKEDTRQRDVVKKMLSEEVEIEFLGIKQNSLPEDLTIMQLDLLEPIIIEDEGVGG